jgi:uncharacterized membrane protein YraQ (UPF0718 family)
MYIIWRTFLDHFNGSHTQRVLQEAFDLFILLWPYLVAGIVLTSLIKIYLSKEKVASFFHKNQRISIVLASLIGIVSPLGSYVVIPLSASLFLLGTPLPVIMTLIVASPLIDPNLFILTAGAFGYQMALARMVSAFLLGISAGYITQWLMQYAVIKGDYIVKREEESIRNSRKSVNGKSGLHFLATLSGMTLYISKYFFLALILAAVIKIMTPANLVLRFFNGSPLLSVLFSTAAGIPFYVCGGAAIPVVRELADLGLPPGAALAFFIAGPVVKISNLLLVYAVYNFRIFLIYLLTGICGAILFGWLYNFL